MKQILHVRVVKGSHCHTIDLYQMLTEGYDPCNDSLN